MLSLQLRDGEYLTIGEDIAVQVHSSATVRVSVKAPKDTTILRGEERERNGENRPKFLHEHQTARAKKCKSAAQ